MQPRSFYPEKQYDLIIAGGGIHGCALAYEASAHGLKVALFEKDDFCANTSANTLKFIHGGIRYLQNFNFKRVWQSLREQALLMHIAPHLVQPITCAMPTTNKLTRNVFAMRAGFFAYKFIAALAGHSGITRNNKVVTKSSFQSIDSWLQHDDYTGVALWDDAQVTYAERLGLEFVLAARRMGADVYNYARVNTIETNNNRFESVGVTDALTGSEHRVKGKTLIVPAGPWRGKMAKLLNLSESADIGHVKAVNVVVNKTYSEWALGLTNRKDKRLFFATPWQDHTLLGTWYFKSPPGETRLNGKTLDNIETDEILTDIRATFPGLDVTAQDFALTHVGWLPADANVDAAHDSLRDEDLVQTSAEFGGPENVWLVSGVKFTTARAVAEQTVERIKNRFPNLKPRLPKSTPLDGGVMADPRVFAADLVKRYETVIPEATLRRLAGTYGANAEIVISYANANAELMQPIPGAENSLRAEVAYAVKNEFARKAEDVLVRRSGLFGATQPPAEAVDFCARLIDEILAAD